MAIVRPFAGLRPRKDIAPRLASPPYDVLNSDEAREMAKDNPQSFLHVIKPEIDLDPGVGPYDKRVYKKGGKNLSNFIHDGLLVQDKKHALYIYKQVMGHHQQIGLAVCASVEEYENDIIRKHELTRPDKEDDRVKLMSHLNAQTGPVFLTYKSRQNIDALIDTATQSEPEYDFVDEKEVKHTFWMIADPQLILQIQSEFAKVDYLYVADGHHRSAAAMRVKQIRQKANPNHTGEEEYNFFLTVIFPDNQMQILDYNRIVKNLNGLDEKGFIESTSQKFNIIKQEDKQQYKPAKKHTFGMYLNGDWYKLKAKDNIFDEKNPVDRLDVSILQNNILSPILDIQNPRQDNRIDFIGGIRGLRELEKRVNSGDWAVAFAIYPTSMDDLIAIANAGEVMPPKSTWFEPKLRSGLVTHLLD